MALVPRTITNALSNPIEILDFVSFAKLPIFLQPGVAVDLLSLASDEDIAKSQHLLHLQSIGAITVSASFDSAETQASNLSAASQTYSGTGSFQTVAGDLVLEAAAGSADGSNPKFLAGLMGNVLDDGAALTKDANYLAGVIGHYSVTGAKATTYPAGAILAGIGDGVTAADGAVVAYVDGDSAMTKANAAFKAMSNNSNPGSGFDYGVDLFGAAHDGYSELGILKADVRMSKEVCILNLAGVPTDGGAGTGAGFAQIGSMAIDRTNGNAYINAGTKASPTWKLVTRAA